MYVMCCRAQVKPLFAEYFDLPLTRFLFPDELVNVITQHIRACDKCNIKCCCNGRNWLEEACHIWDLFVPLSEGRNKQCREWMRECQFVEDIDSFFTMLGPYPFLIIHKVMP